MESFFNLDYNWHMNVFQKMAPVRRARGYRLYLYDQKRLLDLYREEGGAIMGHRVGNALNVMKNLLSRGLLPDYPSIESNRLKKAIQALYPDWEHWVILPSWEFAKLFLKEHQIFYELLLPLCYREDQSPNRVRLVKIPLAGGATPALLALPKGEPLPSWYPKEDFVVSPYLLGASVRAIYDWIAFLPQAQAVDFSWWDEAVFKGGELKVLQGKAHDFVRHGCWIYYMGKSDDYNAVFERCLKEGLLLNPHSHVPSLLPFETTKGEQALIKRVLLGVES